MSYFLHKCKILEAEIVRTMVFIPYFYGFLIKGLERLPKNIAYMGKSCPVIQNISVKSSECSIQDFWLDRSFGSMTLFVP